MGNLIDTSTALHPEWLDWPEIRRVIGIFEAEKIPMCFVGGCVRDAIVGKTPSDFDMIVDSPSEKVFALLRSGGIEAKIVDTGWGVVRAAIGKVEFEFFDVHGKRVLTTEGKRKHEKGDSFQRAIDIWAEHVDVTLNGIYLFPSGELHDHFSAMADLAAGLICFVGDPEDQIRKNTHRPLSLRFFRFYAWFGKGSPDAVSLNAAVAHAPDLVRLHRSSILGEMKKFLSAPKPLASLTLMQEHDILKYALGFSVHSLSSIAALQRLEDILHQVGPWQVRLMLLVLEAPLPPEKALSHVCDFWKMEEKDLRELELLLEYFVLADPDMAPAGRKKLIARLGGDTVKNLLIIRWALEDDVAAAQGRYRRIIDAIA